jgi:hypothetical protein
VEIETKEKFARILGLCREICLIFRLVLELALEDKDVVGMGGWIGGRDNGV